MDTRYNSPSGGGKHFSDTSYDNLSSETSGSNTPAAGSRPTVSIAKSSTGTASGSSSYSLGGGSSYNINTSSSQGSSYNLLNNRDVNERKEKTKGQKIWNGIKWFFLIDLGLGIILSIIDKLGR